MKLIKLVVLFCALIANIGQAKEQLNSRLWVDMKDGEFSVNSNYMTYFATRVTKKDGTKSDLMLVTPASQVLSLPKWGDPAVFQPTDPDGTHHYLPKWDWFTSGGYLETGSANGSLKAPLKDLIGVGWDNSTIDMYGGSVNAWFGQKDASTEDTAVLVGLNLLQGLNITAEIFTAKGGKTPDNETLQKMLKPLKAAQDSLKGAQSWVEFFATSTETFNSVLELIQNIQDASGALTPEDKQELAELTNRLNNAIIVMKQVSSVLNVKIASPNSEESSAIDKSFHMAALSTRLIVTGENVPTGHSEFLQYYAKKVAKKYDDAKSVDEKSDIINNQILGVLGAVSKGYQLHLKEKINDLKAHWRDDGLTQDQFSTQYQSLKRKIIYLRAGQYALDGVSVFLAHETSECGKDSSSIKCQEQFFRGVSGLAMILVNDLFDPEEGALVNTEIGQKMQDWLKTFIGPVGPAVVEKLNAISFIAGTANTIGNKAIPFVWDFIGAPDGFALDIADGQLSRTGVATHKFNVVIKNTATGQVVRTVGIDPSVANKEIKIPINVGETWTATYGIEQPKLFMYDRAPWETISTPQKAAYQLAYEVNVGGQIKYNKNVLCVRKKYLAVGNSAAFSVQKEWGDGYIPAGMVSPPDASGQSTCGAGMNPVNSPWFDSFTAQDIVLPTGVTNRLASYFANKDALSPRDRFDTGAEPIFEVSRAFTAESGNESIKFTAFIPDSYPANIEKTISFVPVIPTITASTSTPTVNTPMTVVLNGIESIVSYIKEIIWTFGQDVVHTIADFTSAVQNIFQTTGEQVITAKIYDTNGNQLGSHTSITVNVVETPLPVASLVGTPTTLTVDQPVDIVIANSKAQSGYLCNYVISFNENSTVIAPLDTTKPPVAPPIHVPASRTGGSCGGFGGDTPVTLSPYNVTFEYAGNFTITLTVTDSQGKTATVTQEVVVSAAQATGLLTATGITTCGNESQNNLPCDSANLGTLFGLGQDGEVQAGQKMSYTVLNQNGSECVKDSVTGLMWEQKTDDGGLRDKDWTYSWYNPDSTKNGGSAGIQNGGNCGGTSGCDTQAYLAALNTANYCGYSDWRMPSRMELTNLVDFSRVNPSINPVFVNTVGSVYWSSSLNASYHYFGYYLDYAWRVNFNYGDSSGNGKTNGFHVRAVRAGQ